MDDKLKKLSISELEKLKKRYTKLYRAKLIDDIIKLCKKQNRQNLNQRWKNLKHLNNIFKSVFKIEEYLQILRHICEKLSRESYEGV